MDDKRTIENFRRELAFFEAKQQEAEHLAASSLTRVAKKYWRVQAAYHGRMVKSQRRLIDAFQRGGREALFTEILVQSGQATALLLTLQEPGGGAADAAPC